MEADKHRVVEADKHSLVEADKHSYVGMHYQMDLLLVGIQLQGSPLPSGGVHMHPHGVAV